MNEPTLEEMMQYMIQSKREAFYLILIIHALFLAVVTHKRATDFECIHGWKAIHRNDFDRKFVLSSPDTIPDTAFLAEQKKYSRVRKAIEDKQAGLISKLEGQGLSLDNFHILITACKAEQKLTIYAKKKEESKYRPLVTYPICATSGTLGPKRQQGDRQIPEGFYHIDRFNPSSSYYLSLGINYPNESDKKKSTAARLGGDIFIHGSCVTIGCLPMTDDLIKEIYLCAIYARNNGQKQIPVYIFPFEMTDTLYARYKEQFKSYPALVIFWNNLRQGYLLFEKEKKELSVKTSVSGDYIFAQ